MAVAMALALLGGVLPLLGWTPIADSLGARLRLWLTADLAVVFWLFVGVARIAKHRFFTPADIDGGGLSAGTQRAHLLQSLLQNTLEQCALAVVVHGAWALLMPDRWTGLVLVYAGTFALGRLLFFARYAHGAAARSLGFALTFYPTVLMLIALIPTAAWQAFTG